MQRLPLASALLSSEALQVLPEQAPLLVILRQEALQFHLVVLLHFPVFKNKYDLYTMLLERSIKKL
jgi:hypothetical protein